MRLSAAPPVETVSGTYSPKDREDVVGRWDLLRSRALVMPEAGSLKTDRVDQPP